MSEQTIILYDDGDWSKGHYEGIFGLYAKACIENGMQVSAACPQPDLIRRQLGPLADRCCFHQTTSHDLKSKFRRLKPLTRLMWWTRAGRTARQIQQKMGCNAQMFFMNINHLRGRLWSDKLSDRLMPCPWSAFIYDSSAVRGGKSDLQKQFNFLNSAQCSAFGVTDEKMAEPMRQAFPNIGIQFLPDATPEEVSPALPLADEVRRAANGRNVAGLLGMLHKRKGLLTALKLAEKCTDTFFLFAGAMDLNKMTLDEKLFVTEFIEHRPDNCFFHLERIEDEADFNALLQAVDAVLAIYPGFTNTSGLLTKAGLFGKPVLVAAGDTCMADRVKKYDLGIAVPENDLNAASDALATLLNRSPLSTQQLQEFRNHFSQKALLNALNSLLS